MANKIKYGLSNVKYAKIINTGGVISYAAPVAIPGAVSVTLDPKGEQTEFYADDINYFGVTANQGYEGSLEIALIPDAFKKDILGFKTDASGALVEDANVLPVPFALMYQFRGDAHNTRHVLYNVSVSRPTIAGQSKGASIEPQTETLEMIASPAEDTGDVKMSIKPADAGYDTFFNAVRVYAAPDAGDALLSALTVGDLVLDPVFDADEDTYVATTTDTEAEVTATPVKTGATIVIECDGETYVSGDTIELALGDNVIEITVTYGPTVEVYTVTVTRTAGE